MRESIVAALAKGRISLADQLADAAIRLERMSPSLAAAVMRVRLRAGRADSAVAASEHAARITPEIHLLRAVAFLECGQWLEAHLELSRAATVDELSPAGLELLAHLEFQAGDRARARELLHESMSRGRERRAVSLLLCDSVVHGERRRARDLGATLAAHAIVSRRRDEVRTLLGALGLPEPRAAEMARRRHIVRLAEELRSTPSVLQSLVELQRQDFDAPSARLIQQAIESAANDMPDPAMAQAASVELVLLLDGPTTAMERLELAIADYPMSAALQNLRLLIAETPAAKTDIEESESRENILARIDHEDQAEDRRRRLAA